MWSYNCRCSYSLTELEEIISKYIWQIITIRKLTIGRIDERTLKEWDALNGHLCDRIRDIWA